MKLRSRDRSSVTISEILRSCSFIEVIDGSSIHYCRRTAAANIVRLLVHAVASRRQPDACSLNCRAGSGLTLCDSPPPSTDEAGSIRHKAGKKSFVDLRVLGDLVVRLFSTRYCTPLPTCVGAIDELWKQPVTRYAGSCRISDFAHGFADSLVRSRIFANDPSLLVKA
jgi:hypothetical protein